MDRSSNIFKYSNECTGMHPNLKLHHRRTSNCIFPHSLLLPNLATLTNEAPHIFSPDSITLKSSTSTTEEPNNNNSNTPEKKKKLKRALLLFLSITAASARAKIRFHRRTHTDTHTLRWNFSATFVMIHARKSQQSICGGSISVLNHNQSRLFFITSDGRIVQRPKGHSLILVSHR